ncbi:Oidioi.mRNA.OKI2018_I69.chr2.g7952.t1.cds [Oikopleura dioica]|uniref:Oidioi.mRNA.OKI2018_I69.chr2.g7952.t1.cds n=1 Tax=Oikopleura dioica TaxID=34765 RepID=A0ABN7TCB0_OIKDI|nr:Oidioi.mRNA.OKI2018_I69.chr2.g7952.t1.cds [Oikopleura dioica]
MTPFFDKFLRIGEDGDGNGNIARYNSNGHESDRDSISQTNRWKRPESFSRSNGPSAKRANTANTPLLKLRTPVPAIWTSPRLKSNQLLDRRYKKAWNKILPHLNTADKFAVYNTNTHFRIEHGEQLEQYAVKEVEKVSMRLFGAEAEGRRLARSYDNDNWSLFRAFMWINEQTYHSVYTFFRYCLRERRQPSNLAMLLKANTLSKLIKQDRIALYAQNLRYLFNRTHVETCELTESPDWYIAFDPHTDQLLVLDLSSGFIEMQKQVYCIHQDSLSYGYQHLAGLLNGTFLKENICVIFNDLMESRRLNIIDLAAENVRCIDADFLGLFNESRLACLKEVQDKLSFMMGQKIFKESLRDIIENFPLEEWKNLKTIGASLLSFDIEEDKSIKAECMFTMKSVTLHEFPASFKFFAAFTIPQESDEVSVESVFRGFEKLPDH